MSDYYCQLIQLSLLLWEKRFVMIQVITKKQGAEI